MAAPTPRPVRKLRHWKQRFDRNARFIWRKGGFWHGQPIVAGGEVTPAQMLQMGKAKLRRLWDSERIELAEFDFPNPRTGVPDAPRSDEDLLPNGVTVEALGGNWHAVKMNGSLVKKVRGSTRLQATIDEIAAEQDPGELEEFPDLPEGVTIEDGEGGSEAFLVTVGDAEPIPFHNREAVEDYLVALAAGDLPAPPSAEIVMPEGFSLVTGGGGWFTVEGEGFDPIKVQGRANLETILDQIRAELAETAAEADRATANLTDGD